MKMKREMKTEQYLPVGGDIGRLTCRLQDGSEDRNTVIASDDLSPPARQVKHGGQTTWGDYRDYNKA